jgi:hypothetical protein
MGERRRLAGSGSLRTDQMQHSLLAAVGSAAAVGVWLSERLGCMFFRHNLQLYQRPAEVEPAQRCLECMLVRDS